jgi:hypothetical protein
MIDYAAQFKLIDYTAADELTVEHKRHRVYTSAEKAFKSAQRTENLGIDVAFATTGFGQYHVWAEPRDRTDYDTCERCERSVVSTSPAYPGDRNSSQWCDTCISRFPVCTDCGCGPCECPEAIDPEAVLAQYEEAVSRRDGLAQADARDKHIMEAQGAIDDMAPALAKALATLLGVTTI